MTREWNCNSTHIFSCFDSVYLTRSYLGFSKSTPSIKSIKPHKPSKASEQFQQSGVSQKPPKGSIQATTSMNWSTFQFIEGPVMNWSVDVSVYSRLRSGSSDV